MVNEQETEHIVFSTEKKLKLKNTVLKIDNEKIVESNCVKYLGVIIDSKLKFHVEVKKFFIEWLVE